MKLSCEHAEQHLVISNVGYLIGPVSLLYKAFSFFKMCSASLGVRGPGLQVKRRGHENGKFSTQENQWEGLTRIRKLNYGL